MQHYREDWVLGELAQSLRPHGPNHSAAGRPHGSAFLSIVPLRRRTERIVRQAWQLGRNKSSVPALLARDFGRQLSRCPYHIIVLYRFLLTGGRVCPVVEKNDSQIPLENDAGCSQLGGDHLWLVPRTLRPIHIRTRICDPRRSIHIRRPNVYRPVGSAPCSSGEEHSYRCCPLANALPIMVCLGSRLWCDPLPIMVFLPPTPAVPRAPARRPQTRATARRQ
jgi:hypothetical protein